MFSECDIEKSIMFYKRNGIVTRKECINLDSRPLSEEILAEMRNKGCEEAMMTEAHLDGFSDYSRVIFDPDRFEPAEADEYLIKNVLSV